MIFVTEEGSVVTSAEAALEHLGEGRPRLALPVAMVGARLFVARLEPKTSLRSLIGQWEGHLWMVISLDEEAKPLAEEVAEGLGLALEETAPYAAYDDGLVPFPLPEVRAVTRHEKAEFTPDEEQELVEALINSIIERSKEDDEEDPHDSLPEGAQD